jgi:hypothetical protein
MPKNYGHESFGNLNYGIAAYPDRLTIQQTEISNFNSSKHSKFWGMISLVCREWNLQMPKRTLKESSNVRS